MSLATDSDLAQLKKKLEFEIDYVENPGKYKAGAKPHAAWQVAQSAYEKQLQMVETRIQIIPLENDYNTLLGFKTTSKEFKGYLAKAKEAIDAGDPITAQHFINVASSKKSMLERSRKRGKSSIGVSGTFADSAFTQAEKDKALWFGGNLQRYEAQKGWNEADRHMSPYAEELWRRWSDEQKHVGYLYTTGSRYINEPLFARYYGTKTSLIDGSARDCWTDINTLTDMIAGATPLREGMWVQHGEDFGAFAAKFGVDLSMATKAEINGLVGATGINKPFTSCGCAKYSGFSHHEVVMNIYCPKGTRGIYTEPYSHFGDSDYGTDGYHWNGKPRKKDSSYENEFILQRGAVFKITKIEYNRAEDKWYVDVELRAQPEKKHGII